MKATEHDQRSRIVEVRNLLVSRGWTVVDERSALLVQWHQINREEPPLQLRITMDGHSLDYVLWSVENSQAIIIEEDIERLLDIITSIAKGT